MPEPKRVYRSRRDKVIAGVCGGIGEYFNIDAVWVRLVAVLLALADGVGVILYIVAWIIIPQNPRHPATARTSAEETAAKLVSKAEQMKEKRDIDSGSFWAGVILIVVGAAFLLKYLLGLSFKFVWPALVLLLGVYLPVRRK